MYSKIQTSMGEIAIVNGRSGKYDGKVNNASVCYGRNAVDSYNDYLSHYALHVETMPPNLKGLSQLSDDQFESKMSEFDKWIADIDRAIKAMAPVKFQYRYSPELNNGIDPMALLGASYEEMGKRTSITIEEANENFGDDETLDASAIDLNKDSKIDLGEYATTILLADKLSSKDGIVNGEITNEGMNKSMAYYNKNSYEIATRQYQSLYQTYDLKEAQNKFLADSNNLL